MKNKFVNISINIAFILLIIIMAAFLFLLFPVQTGIYAVILSSSSKLGLVDIGEIITCYLSAIIFIVTLFFLFIAKKKYKADLNYSTPLFCAGVLLCASGALFFIANFVFFLFVRLISFELIDGLIGLIILAGGLIAIAVSKKDKQ